MYICKQKLLNKQTENSKVLEIIRIVLKKCQRDYSMLTLKNLFNLNFVFNLF